MRDTHCIEPAARSPEAPRRIATFFGFVALVGCIPAVVGLAYYLAIGLMGIEIAAEGLVRADSVLDVVEVVGGVTGYGIGAGFIALGFAQLRFYFRRANGPVRHARRWWMSTYLYNLIGLGTSLAVVYGEPHIGGFIGTIWFAFLCALAIGAYTNERPSGHARPRVQS